MVIITVSVLTIEAGSVTPWGMRQGAAVLAPVKHDYERTARARERPR